MQMLMANQQYFLLSNKLDTENDEKFPPGFHEQGSVKKDLKISEEEAANQNPDLIPPVQFGHLLKYL